ncbi:uncharacterized protein LTR77_006668 [Saxophila tyrrhenica]|uniref:Concanavalin A-like lectin/glucanase domain-containing protein n=1 Tax=Saxophila tyrrhenica TaxID=1690608 RepID=A0AAV9P8F6_9PEZI|nr:hypothetical protein LTR77_006668 [Saxophila tyrrhenica]
MYSFAATALLALAATVSAIPVSQVERRQSYPAPKDMCGAPNESLLIPGTPWIVFSMNYNYQQIHGSICTGFNGVKTVDGVQKCKWTSDWDMEPADNPDTVKGYSFVGLTQNLENRISDIKSIPADYHWIRKKATPDSKYKGNVVFDFMTSDTKGDSTSSHAQEHMLWLRYEGGQLPIGWVDGPIATINNLYGRTWDLYRGLNEDTGIMVSSLLVRENQQFHGHFKGDIKDWLVALSKQGLYTQSTYVNVGNAGMEPFYGMVSFTNSVALSINL